MRSFLYAAFSAALLALGAGLAAPAAHAQGLTTAALTGVVTDAAGEPLPGANVVALHVPSGTQVGAATRLDGRYDLPGLRVGGPYVIRASFLGFETQEITDIQLALSQTLELNFALGSDEATLGEISVEASRAGALISTERTGAATSVSEESIESLPTIFRSLADFARLSPLASVSNSGTSVGGRNNRYNNIQIDGATLNDVFGLAGSGTPGGQSGTQPVSLDAVETFNVDVAPYDVRSGGFTGGLINVVTRSGTNRFGGSVRFLTRDESFVGDRERNGLLLPYNAFTDNIYVGTFGGPILRDRLFFFVSGELAQSDFPNETGLLGSNAANIFPATDATVQQIIDVAQGTYGYNPGGFDLLSNARDSYKLLGKIDWNINPMHRLSLRHNFVSADDDQGNTRSTGTFDLSNRLYQFRSIQNSTAATLNSTFSSRLFNEARLVYTAIRDERAVPSGAAFPSVTVRLTPTEIVQLGTERSSQANALDQDLFEFTDNVSLFAGAHSLTFGTSNQFFAFRNLFIQDYYGTYEFTGGFQADVDGDGDLETTSGIDAFQLGSPSRYRLSYASPLAFDDQGRLRVTAAGVPVREVAAGESPQAEFLGGQLGLYAQDAWTVRPGLRLTLGLRADLPFFPDSPTVNPLVSGGTAVVDGTGTEVTLAPAFREEAYVRAYARANGLNEDATVASYNAGTFTGPQFEDYSELSTGEVPNGNLLLSPRLGVNYQTTGLAGQQLQVRGGTGIFSGRTPYVWISNQYANTGADFARLDATFAATAPAPIGFFPGTANPADQPVPLPDGSNGLSPIATSALALTDPDFRFPQIWRSNLGFDHTLGEGFTATVEGIYSSNLYDVAFQNLNLVQTGAAADGRPLYSSVGASGFNTLPRVDRNFIDTILMTNTRSGYEYSLVAQVQRQVNSGFGGSLSYTFGRAFTNNSATNSTAYSNWRFNESQDPNDVEELGISDFEVRHRFLGFANYRATYGGRFSTQIGLIADVRSGEPFSYIYGNDANGDGETSNDLVYVPASANDVFVSTNNYAVLDAFINGESGLRDYRGQIVPRNTGTGPWQPRFDVELTQGIETVRGQRVDFEITLVNLLNFLDADLGAIRFANNNAFSAINFERYITTADVGNRVAGRVVTLDDIGKPVVSFTEQTVRNVLTGDRFSTSDLASRWQLRFGVRYTF